MYILSGLQPVLANRCFYSDEKARENQTGEYPVNCGGTLQKGNDREEDLTSPGGTKGIRMMGSALSIKNHTGYGSREPFSIIIQQI